MKQNTLWNENDTINSGFCSPIFPCFIFHFNLPKGPISWKEIVPLNGQCSGRCLSSQVGGSLIAPRGWTKAPLAPGGVAWLFNSVCSCFSTAEELTSFIPIFVPLVVSSHLQVQCFQVHHPLSAMKWNLSQSALECTQAEGQIAHTKWHIKSYPGLEEKKKWNSKS